MTKHRDSGVIPDALMADLLLALPGTVPPPTRVAAMRAALMRNAVDHREAELPAATRTQLIVRANSGRWINFAPNVDMKILHDDGATRSWLARFGPGGRIPSHIQTGDEEGIVLQGWCLLDDERISTGDYHRIGVGERHGNIVSPEGCLIFVRSHSAKRHASELIAAR